MIKIILVIKAVSPDTRKAALELPAEWRPVAVQFVFGITSEQFALLNHLIVILAYFCWLLTFSLAIFCFFDYSNKSILFIKTTVFDLFLFPALIVVDSLIPLPLFVYLMRVSKPVTSTVRCRKDPDLVFLNAAHLQALPSGPPESSYSPPGRQ